MSLNIEVFYSFQSPYSYLALDSIYEIESKYDVEILWQPFSARAAGQPIQSTGVNPDKLSYLFEDTKRFAEENKLPFIIPALWPEEEFDPGRVTRGAVVSNDMGVLKEFNYKVFHKWWGLGENPNEENFLNQLCDDLDIDLGDFLSKISSTDTRERIKGIHKRGKKMGVFDTPTFIIDKERFVGLDKISYLESRIQKMTGKR